MRRARCFRRAVLHQDAHRSTAAQLAHDLGIHPRNGREAARPVVAIVRPGDPGGLVRLPFGGHAEAEGARRLRASIDHAARRSDRKRRCGGRAGRASCGAYLRWRAGRTRRSEFPRVVRGFGHHLAEGYRRRTSRPRIPCRAPAGLRSPRDSPTPHKRHWRWRARAGWCARHRAAPRRYCCLFRRDASRWPWGRTAPARRSSAASRAASGNHWSQQTSGADAAEAGIEGAKSQVAGSEVIFLEVERIVGDVHLAIEAEQRPIGVDDERPYCDTRRRCGARTASRR